VAFGYTYSRDNADRLNSIMTYIQPGFSSNLLTSNAFSGLSFYPGGAVHTANLGIDPTSQIPALALSRSYDNRGRVTGEVDTNSLQQSAYSYSVSYDGNNNVTGYNDSVTGTWTVTNDALHRLSSMAGTTGGVATTVQETYDHFGNRNVENVTYAGSQSQPSPYLTFSAGNNRIDYGVYDNAGNLLYDLTNNYLYDAENRLCAVQQTSTGRDMFGYVYGANGNRLGKGRLTSFTCDLTKNGLLTANGIALTTGYDSGLEGEQLEVTDGSFNMQQYNVLWEGRLLGTFAGTTADQSNWHFALNDWLGTKRVTTKSDGTKWTSIFSGPFGDYQSQTGPGSDPSAHHFTSRERDIESNLDYFPARYYNSNGGRFMSPDWSSTPQAVPYANLADPQSLNLYSYARNNPLVRIDKDGHCWSWLQGACSVFEQAYHGLFTDYGFKTNAQVSQVNEQNRKWLNQNNVVTPDKNGNTIDWNKASASQVRGAYAAAANAMILRLIHGPETISGAAMDSVRKMSTADIIDSLKNGDQPGIIKPDGTVMNGNTRLSVLQERGVDINSLGLQPDPMYGEFSAAEGAAAQSSVGQEGAAPEEPMAGPASADPELPE
jgi:RHS repeat-associated protein